MLDYVDIARANKYSTSIDDLERAARVPVDQQITERPDAPADSPITTEELVRQRLLGITGATG